MPNLKIALLAAASTLIISPLFSQKNSVPPFSFALEGQVYPYGLIGGFTFERTLRKNKGDLLHLRLGYNFIRRGDAGVHEDERGEGYGFTVGYRRYFRKTMQGMYLGARHDVWFNSIRWKDFVNSPSELAGTTQLLVLQPTMEGGYAFAFGDEGHVFFTPALALGLEINARTRGELVGQGLILLGGFSLGKRF